MSGARGSITDVVASILQDLCTPETVRQCEAQGWNQQLWSVLDDAGFTTISVPEERGGSGGDVADACAVLKEVGRFAAAVPVAENSLLGGWALAAAGLPLPTTGPATTAVGSPGDDARLSPDGQGWRLSGRVHRVPWGRQATCLVLVAPVDGADHVVQVPLEGLPVLPGTNLAGESRDTVVLDGAALSAEQVAPAPPRVSTEALRVRGALARAMAASGALSRATDLTVAYTRTRQQFGRPLARFQAVQRHMVRIAERAQEAGIAAEAAALNARPEPDFFDVAAAKIVAGEAATLVSAASHQAHGAIGMTKEYALGQVTRRLWAWRDEFGSEAYWSRRLGRRVVAAGADQLWPRVSTGCVAVDDAEA
jgi:acyl-CoA dehydrogenase